jgi:hypothetical protein
VVRAADLLYTLRRRTPRWAVYPAISLHRALCVYARQMHAPLGPSSVQLISGLLAVSSSFPKIRRNAEPILCAVAFFTAQPPGVAVDADGIRK